MTDLNQICRFGRTLAVDLELFFDSSIDVPMANNFCLFNPHIFFVSDQYVTNFVQANRLTHLKGSPYSITERRVPELIPVLGSQPAGDVSHKPGGRLPLLCDRPAVTPATFIGGLLPILLFVEQRHGVCEQFA